VSFQGNVVCIIANSFSLFMECCYLYRIVRLTYNEVAIVLRRDNSLGLPQCLALAKLRVGPRRHQPDWRAGGFW
jgi:hypothetical protein